MGKRILVVDDSTAVRQSVQYILEEAGYEVVQAQDGEDGLKKLHANEVDLGEDGLKKLHANEVDLVITDVNMPNMDGIELTGKIRSGETNQYVPIVILTTESQRTKMDEGEQAGATGWIVKPFNADKLLQVVRRLIG
jgi:two-component system chemotaxis response regulator CheY